MFTDLIEAGYTLTIYRGIEQDEKVFVIEVCKQTGEYEFCEVTFTSHTLFSAIHQAHATMLGERA